MKAREFDKKIDEGGDISQHLDISKARRPEQEQKMNHDDDKIDEYTLALLYLVTHERHEGMGARAWKGFDWDTLNRLHGKGYLSNPIGKAKSVGMTEEGFLKAKELFERYFAKKEEKAIPFPKFTPAAKKRWEQVPGWARKEIVEEVWCSQCRIGVPLLLREGEMIGRSLVLRGTCKKCGSEIARVIEPTEPATCSCPDSSPARWMFRNWTSPFPRR